jgi:membrane fusion protein
MAPARAKRPLPGPGVGLFREQVIDAQANRLWGDVVLVQPLSTRVLTPLLLALALAAGAFVSMAPYPRTETAAGFLAPGAGVSKLYPRSAGIVESLAVDLGQSVVEGQVLMTISAGTALSDGRLLERDLREQLLQQKRQIEAKLTAAAELSASQQRRGREGLEALHAQIAQVEGTRTLLAKRIQLAAQREGRFATLRAKGLLSEMDYQKERDTGFSLSTEIRQLDAEILKRKDEINVAKAELEAGPLRDAQQRADFRFQLADLEARLREMESRSSYAIQAPIHGRIAMLQATPGASVSPEMPVAIVMPADARFEANLFVPTRAIGLIEPGQPVGIRYTAFPYQQFGVYRGRVRRVESAILNPTELKIPVRLDEAVYRVIVEPDAQSVVTSGRSYPLQAGMLLEAEIVLERRSILEWILEPLYSLRRAS